MHPKHSGKSSCRSTQRTYRHRVPQRIVGSETGGGVLRSLEYDQFEQGRSEGIRHYEAPAS